MEREYDAIVIGAGHNGLVCAAYLAKAGLKVIALERREVIGGACVTEELWPGYQVSTAAYVNSLLQPQIIEDLELRSYGFEMLPFDHLFHPFPDGRYLVVWDDVKKTCEEIARFSKRDAAAFPDFQQFRQAAAAFVRDIMWMTPPNPVSRRWRDLRDLLSLGLKLHRMGGKAFRFMDLMTESISAFLDRWFESDHVKTALAWSGSVGTFAGPKTPGTAYVLLHHSTGGGQRGAQGGWGFVRGGMGTISRAIARAAEKFGATIRTGAPIERILVRNGRAVGVVLESGEEIRGKSVASNADPKRTFLRLVGPEALDGEFVREVKSLKTFSTAFKMNLAMEEAPRYTAFDPRVVGSPYPCYVHIAPSIAYLEKAFDDARYGRPSAEPFISPLVPTMADDTLAPRGKHIVNIFGGHAPYSLAGADWSTERERFADRVIEVLAQYAPGVKQAIIHRQVLVPPDLETRFGLTEGHIFHAELSLEQLFFKRPVGGYADYRTPIRGLYLCGSGVHPGGGVMGVPGHNAARELLRDRRSGKLR